jgi:hypothetical protein
MILNKDFKEFIESLNDNRVRYLVVGGYAVALHGHPRYTKNVDFESCYPARTTITIDGVNVDFIDLANLKKNKQATGRHQDLADLENLR